MSRTSSCALSSIELAEVTEGEQLISTAPQQDMVRRIKPVFVVRRMLTSMQHHAVHMAQYCWWHMGGEECAIALLRSIFYLLIILAADFAAHRAHLLEGNLLANDLAVSAKYLWTGVYAMESADFDAEATAYASHLRVRPGMTVCEMGAADGALLARVGKYAMPGGTLIATAPKRAELLATSRAIRRAGLGVVQTYLATSEDWAPGLAPNTCDVIYSRMVIHMVNIRIIRRYIPQLSAALKPGGRMFMTDHNPKDGTLDGPARPIEYRLGVIPMMWVLPQNTEVAEVTAGGYFRVSEGPFGYPFFQGGYGVVYAPTGENATHASSIEPDGGFLAALSHLLADYWPRI